MAPAWLVIFSSVGASAGPLEFTVEPPENWRFNRTRRPMPRFTRSRPTASSWWPLRTPGVRECCGSGRLRGPRGADLPGQKAEVGPFGHLTASSSASSQTTSSRPSAQRRFTTRSRPAPDWTAISGAWNRKGLILFSDVDGLHKVLSGGGNPTSVTARAKDETGHLWPSFLADDDHFLYLAQRPGANELRVGPLMSPDTTSLGPVERMPCTQKVRLFFVQGDTLMVQSFDSTRASRQAIRSLSPITPQSFLPCSAVLFVSATVLAYSRAGRPPSQLTWIDRSGKQLTTTGDPGFYMNPI